MPTDKQLRDAAVVELKKTTQGYLKSNGQPRAIGAQWKKGLDLLAQIGAGIPPPSTSHPLVGSQVTLDPGEIAAWNIFDSPTSQIVGAAGDQYSRIIAWDGLYKPPAKCYSLHGFKLVQGNPGRMFDWHPSPFGGTWGEPGKVAPLAIDYFGAPGSRDPGGLMVTVQPEDWSPTDSGGGKYHFQIFTQAEIEARRSQWVWLWLEVIWGRSDLPVDGSLKVWVAGEDVPRVNVSNINTHWAAMRHVTFWEGAYVSAPGAPSKVVVQLAATRIGRTPRECFDDKPVLWTRRPAGTPGGAAVGIAPVEGGSVPVPSALRW